MENLVHSMLRKIDFVLLTVQKIRLSLIHPENPSNVQHYFGEGTFNKQKNKIKIWKLIFY